MGHVLFAAAEAADAVCGDYAVAGDEKGDGVCAARSADGARGGTDFSGDIAVGDGFARGDIGERLADFLLVGGLRAAEGEVQGVAAGVFEIGAELFCGFGGEEVLRGECARFFGEVGGGEEGGFVAGDGDDGERRGKQELPFFFARGVCAHCVIIPRFAAPVRAVFFCPSALQFLFAFCCCAAIRAAACH